MLANHPPIAVETAEPTVPFDDPDCRYVALPDTMRTFAPPVVQDWRQHPKGQAVLAQLAAGLVASPGGMGATVIDLFDHDLDTREFIGQLLGEGEISILADRPGERLTVSEAVFAGVWRVKH